MTQDNVMEFCQWLIDEKGVGVGELSEYISEHKSDLDELSSQFKKFQNGGVVSKQKPIEKSDKMKYYVDKVMPYRLNKNIAKELNSVSTYNVPNIVHDVDKIRMIPIPTPEHQDVNENSSWGGVEGALKRAINDKKVLSKIGYGSMMFKCGGKTKKIKKAQDGGNIKQANTKSKYKLIDDRPVGYSMLITKFKPRGIQEDILIDDGWRGNERLAKRVINRGDTTYLEGWHEPMHDRLRYDTVNYSNNEKKQINDLIDSSGTHYNTLNDLKKAQIKSKYPDANYSESELQTAIYGYDKFQDGGKLSNLLSRIKGLYNNITSNDKSYYSNSDYNPAHYSLNRDGYKIDVQMPTSHIRGVPSPDARIITPKKDTIYLTTSPDGETYKEGRHYKANSGGTPREMGNERQQQFDNGEFFAASNEYTDRLKQEAEWLLDNHKTIK